MNLVSFYGGDQLAEFDPKTGAIQCWSRKQRPELAASILGTFSRVNDELVALYRSDRALNLWVADQEFEVTDEINSELKDEGPNREFRLLRGRDIIVTITYLRPELEIPLDIDPTPGVEEEHFDYLLFVHNVLTEPGRRVGIWND